jgi:4-amino-4-deoxy-L-arabinose transferase-like glycosyltransferase
MKARDYLWWMVAVLLVATALRLVAFGEVPPGLYHDEAYHGLDAVDILQGQRSFYFPANNGREPLFIYLIALAVGLLGRSPFALRLVAFFAGLLTVAATAAMGRVLFSRRAGVLAAAVLAVTLWHVHLSRVGFRAVLLPLFVALVAWQGALGIRGAEAQESKGAGKQARRTGWWRHWLAAGAFYGLSFYTYTAARFTPVAVAAFGLYVLATRPAIRPWRRLRSAWAAIRGWLWRGVGLAVLAALLVVAPLAVYAVGHPGVVLGRPGQVSVFNPVIHGGDLWGTLAAHTLRTLGMFFVRGDRIWRHNVPWRPIFDPLLGAAFILGLVIALRRARRQPAAGFVLIWTTVMSLPTFLAEDAPHFLRAVGVLPLVVFLPALGLDWLADRVRLSSSGRLRPSAGRVAHGIGHSSLVTGHWLILVLPLLFGLGSTAWAYFGDYARDPTASYWFEQGAVVLAGRVNGFLGVGWDGDRMVWENLMGLGSADRRVYVDPTLWEQWPQVRFLVAEPEAVTIGFEGEQLPKPQSPLSNPQVAVFVWPYGDWQQSPLRLRALLPAPAEVSVEEGPRSQGDRDPKPYTTYLAFFGGTPDPAAPALARFSGGVELLGVAVMPVDAGRLRVRLRWRATAPFTEDYTVFLHYLRDGERVAQADSQPAGGRYPTTVWRVGDVVDDDHDVEGVGAPLPGRDVLLFGLWQPESGAVLYLLDEAGNPAGDWIEVPVDGG